MIHIENNRSGCPISTSLEILGDTWTLIIIRDLFLERNTFKEFMNGPEKISSNILSDRLRKLQKYKLIGYFVNPVDKKIKKYYLTEAGINLFPVIYNLIMWSKNHIEMDFAPISIEWYENNYHKPQDLVISESISAYRSFRDELFETQELEMKY
ncbi:MAG: helix-turn-helix domain-containing protein [Flavobacteriaceae bacterium]|jgi:DNA-binding HxlR family transcriptional regulator|nr:helix-turn-helix domain-containing protein [Flavobacteriaceae bacterium]MDG1912542.1 helix-turn-helix domain-containing protein [Flavobacteriaceae bacterium]